jgi:hypothetical protein
MTLCARANAARLWTLLGCLACVTAVLHWANLLYLAHYFACSLPRLTCPGLTSPWITRDTGSYRIVEGDIAHLGFLHASYLYRTPGFPLMLGAARLVFGDETLLLWFVPLLAAVGCMAAGWLAFAFTRRRRAALVAGLLFLAWPNAYALTPLLITDAAHGYLALIAFALTLAWIRTSRTLFGWLAGALWMATQSIRPTFFPLPLLLPILLWRRGPSRSAARVSLGIWLASTAVPTFIIASNGVQHGLAVVSILEPETLACYAIPRMQEELGLGNARDLRETVWNRYRSIEDVPERAATERREAWAFIGAHTREALVSFRNELTEQLLTPMHPPNLKPLMGAPGRSWLVLHGPIALFWFSAALGWILLAMREPRIALFMSAVFIAVMGPATTSHWVGDRLRFPLDLLFIPLAVVFIDWGCVTIGHAAERLAPAHRQGRSGNVSDRMQRRECVPSRC